MQSFREYRATVTSISKTVAELMALERSHDPVIEDSGAVVRLLASMSHNDQLWTTLPLNIEPQAKLELQGLPADIARRIAMHSDPEKHYLAAYAEARACELSVAHTHQLKAILAKHGWVSVTRFGEQASRDAWLIAQHADFDPQFQREVLALMEQAVGKGEAIRSNVAYLADRVAVNSDRPQLYGTQYRPSPCGGHEPAPIADPDELEERRQQMGLMPMAFYDQLIGKRCD